MGLDDLQYVYKHSGHTGATRAVLNVLATAANAKREAYPSLATIAKHAGVTRRSAARAMGELKASGWIVDIGKRLVPGTGGKQHTVLYRLGW